MLNRKSHSKQFHFLRWEILPAHGVVSYLQPAAKSDEFNSRSGSEGD
jgi:hypothetical protein